MKFLKSLPLALALFSFIAIAEEESKPLETTIELSKLVEPGVPKYDPNERDWEIISENEKSPTPHLLDTTEALVRIGEQTNWAPAAIKKLKDFMKSENEALRTIASEILKKPKPAKKVGSSFIREASLGN